MLDLDSLAVTGNLAGWARTKGGLSTLPDISANLGILDATFFLYPSLETARAGAEFGGSGVIVGVPLISRPDLYVRYAITNWHVAISSGCSVIRLNKSDGGVHIIEYGPEDWHFIPAGPDLAAVLISIPADVKSTCLPLDMFVTDAEGEAFVGDDIFTVGRFIDYDGHETNQPALRYGAISMMDASVRQKTGFQGRSIVVDTHSRSGFSGSPVYIYRPGGFTQVPIEFSNNLGLPKLEGPKASLRTWGMGNNTQIKLLGIHWGQFAERWEIERQTSFSRSPPSEEAKITSGEYVAGLSGMSCICPASQIVQLLSSERLFNQRVTAEEKGLQYKFPKAES